MSPHFLFDFVLSFILKTAFCMLFCSLLSFCSVNRTRSGYLLLSVCLSKCFFQLSHWIHQKFCICWIYCWKIDWNSGLSSPHFSQLNCRVWTGVRSVCTLTSAFWRENFGFRDQSVWSSSSKSEFFHLNKLRLDSNIEWKSWNNTYLNIIELLLLFFNLKIIELLYFFNLKII